MVRFQSNKTLTSSWYLFFCRSVSSRRTEHEVQGDDVRQLVVGIRRNKAKWQGLLQCPFKGWYTTSSPGVQNDSNQPLLVMFEAGQLETLNHAKLEK